MQEIKLYTRYDIEQIATRIIKYEVRKQVAAAEERIREELKLRARQINQTLSKADSVGVLKLSLRSNNCLERANVTTIGELTSLSESDLLRQRNFGRKCLQEIKDALELRGLDLSASNSRHPYFSPISV